MIFYSPQNFDANEWYLIAVIVLEIITILVLPRRFPWLIKIVIYCFNFFLGQTVDFMIAVAPIDLYDVNDTSQYEFTDFILYVFTYPLAAYLVIYIYDKWKPAGWKLVGFIWGIAILTTGLEAVSNLFHVFSYKGWKLEYSVFVYAVVYGLNIAIVNKVQKSLKQAHQAAAPGSQLENK